jgi:hypothetical protein
MSFEERNAVTGIITGLVVWGIMIVVLGQNTAAGVYDGSSGTQAWAQDVLWLILIGIGLAIVGTVVFNIGYVLVTGEKIQGITADERDKGIGLRAMQAAHIVMATGIVLAIAYLAFGGALIVFLNGVLAVCALASLASEVTKLFLYRRGY